MQAEILGAITKIESEKQAERVAPSYAVCLEVCKRLRLEKSVLLSELEKMKQANMILRIGDTINDTYILLQPLEKYL